MSALQSSGFDPGTDGGKRLATLQAFAAMLGVELTIGDDLAHVQVKASDGAVRIWSIADAERAFAVERGASA